MFVMCDGCWAWKELAGDLMRYWKLLVSLIVALPLYWGMVTAFHLLNLPSDWTVIGGVCLLLLIAVCGFIAFRSIWRRS